MHLSIEEIYSKVEESQLLPLYTVNKLEYLEDLEDVLVSNGLNIIEVTFRSDLAIPAIKKLSESGKLIVGAGTVRTVDEAKEAIENGAQFIVSPAISKPVVEFCLANSIPIFPGTATPRDIQDVLNYGIKIVKFFPANIYGGLKAIKALSGPFYDVKFLPTGGIDETNYLEYLDNEKVIAVGGSFIVSEEMLSDPIQASNHINKLVNQLKKK